MIGIDADMDAFGRDMAFCKASLADLAALGEHPIPALARNFGSLLPALESMGVSADDFKDAVYQSDLPTPVAMTVCEAVAVAQEGPEEGPETEDESWR